MFPSTFESIYPLYGLISVFRSQKQYIWLSLLVLLVLVSALGIGVRLQPVASASVIAPKTASQTDNSASIPASAAATTPPPAPLSPPALPSTGIATPQNCTPPTYTLPSQINLTNQASGLTQIIDPITFYQIYGSTATQIKAQLQQCAPIVASVTSEGGSFAAETGGNLAWQYSVTSNGSGVCGVTNVKVGLHINMILPTWQPTSSASNVLTNEWQNLIRNLTIHENGHVALYQQYANQLLNGLQTLPAADCGSIAATIEAKAAAGIAALNAANHAYDAQTNHGVNQGAVLR